MTELEAIQARHSVRQFLDKPLLPAVQAELEQEIDLCNEESGLHIQLITQEPKAFQGFLARYGKFSGVSNYLCMIGPKSRSFEELCGWYGERLVLKAQSLGLNTCWVGLTYSKVEGVYTVLPGEKLALVIALGYGTRQGVPHRSKNAEDVMDAVEPIPAWFMSGVQAALLAPTAMNQQKFRFILNPDNSVTAKAGSGAYAKVDLGIAKYHFQVGAGKEHVVWK